MKRLPIVIVALTSMAGMADAGNINVRFQGERPDTVLVNMESYAEYVVGSTTVDYQRIPLQGDSLAIEVDDDETMMVKVWPLDEDTNILTVFINPGETVTATLTGRRMASAKVTGSPFMEALTQYKEMMDSIRTSEAYKKLDRGDAIMATYQANADYALRHSNEDIGVYVASRLPLAMASQILDSIGPEAREGMMKPLYDVMKSRSDEFSRKQQTVNSFNNGGMAPDFTVKTLDGEPVTLSQFRDRWVLLDFWATWCGWCIKGFPELEKFAKQEADRVTVIAVSCDYHEEPVADFMKDKDYPWITVWSNRASGSGSSPHESYCIESLPTKLLIAPDGHVVLYQVGEEPEFLEKCRDIINARR